MILRGGVKIERLGNGIASDVTLTQGERTIRLDVSEAAQSEVVNECHAKVDRN